MFMLKIEVQMLNLVLHSLHWFYWIWCCPWCPAFRKKQMVMLQNLCAKVKPSSAFFYINFVKRRINLYDVFQPLGRSSWLCLKMDVQMLNQFYIHYIDFVKSKNQWMQIWKHAYDDVQLSEWSRQRSSYCMHFCHYTVFTHSLYCPLKFIKLKYILDTCSIYRFWIWTMDLTYKKLIYFCNLRKFHSRFFMTFLLKC